ncbi:hypothetical protein [Rheinheimera soli]|jgi:hypothetical protein|uniref:Uncharacterized protein n=1 Tax=Rheinheimera soli TaxID=443616 RepID=A0ABU1W423_9GAMM|nr:hypothetical protein [Rheinheimera soli]MDR7122734.1 hypothetical protein [Rheinheimera soli]
MDVLFPYLYRPPGTPAGQPGPMIAPVFKDAKISAYEKEEKRFLILLKDQQKKRQDRRRSDDYPAAPETTPEEEQHADDEGHLDIFV